MKTLSFLAVFVSAFSFIETDRLFAQGSLTPPGPPAPTMKTLDQIEPRIEINSTNTPGDTNSAFRISQPGSYYLAANVSGVSGKNGIKIDASNVTIDLMGFTVQGVAGSLDGISNTITTANNVRIVNGTVTGWGEDGLQLNFGTNHHIAQVHSRSNSGWGIIVDENALVESCTISANGAGGIGCNGQNSIVRSCAAYGNTSTGILLVNGGLVEGSTAYTNGTGIQTSLSSTVIGCSARDNTADGIAVSGTCTVQSCSSYSNGDDGIVATSTSTTITNCTTSFNTGDGIEVPGNCTLLQNTCDANGQGAGIGAGLKVTGTDCRIDGNTIMRNDLGMDVQLTGNFIVRNTASGNTTNYQIVASNKVGVIVNAPNSVAISGATGGAGVGSTDPWANFSY
jgi:parallel beta-helix repeat protein